VSDEKPNLWDEVSKRAQADLDASILADAGLPLEPGILAGALDEKNPFTNEHSRLLADFVKVHFEVRRLSSASFHEFTKRLLDYGGEDPARRRVMEEVVAGLSAMRDGMGHDEVHMALARLREVARGVTTDQQAAREAYVAEYTATLSPEERSRFDRETQAVRESWTRDVRPLSEEEWQLNYTLSQTGVMPPRSPERDSVLRRLYAKGAITLDVLKREGIEP